MEGTRERKKGYVIGGTVESSVGYHGDSGNTEVSAGLEKALACLCRRREKKRERRKRSKIMYTCSIEPTRQKSETKMKKAKEELRK